MTGYAFAVLLVAAGLSYAAEDGREIVRRSVTVDRENYKLAEQYTYVERQEQRELDGDGHLKRRTISSYDVTLSEGSPYRRLIARDDKPLSADEETRERAKLEKSIAQRKAETRAQREKRLADWKKRRAREREFLRELPDAYNFQLLGEQTIDGRKTYAIEATPRPGFKPKTPAGKYLPKFKGKMWIDAETYDFVRLEAQSIETVSFGGILARLSPGGRLMVEQTRVNNEIWLPKHVTVTISARVLLLKRLGADVDLTFRDYRKFQSESRIVSVEAAP